MDLNSENTARKSGEKRSLDAGRFRQLFRDYHDRLVYSIMGFVGDRAKAEDIVARAFAIAWEKRGMFRGESLPYTWIRAIAQNEARITLRREQIAPSESIDQVDAREIPAPGLITDQLEKREDQRRVHSALEQIPPIHRRVLSQHFIDELPIRAIADGEKVPCGTVLSRMSTGKQLLRDALENPSQDQRPGAPDPQTRDR